MTEVIEIIEVSDALPLKHQFGKLLVATVAAFAASKAAEKAYTATLTMIKNRSITPTEG